MANAAAAVFLFALNAYICARLFRTEYLVYLSSIEGAFIAMARYIAANWPTYTWFPLWYEGMPWSMVYQPALHYAVAAVSVLSHWSAAHAYHFVTAVTYSLGAVALFGLALALGLERWAALVAALMYSLFSPSLLFLPAIRIDAGGLWSARRLQALVVYGEGPNVTGQMLMLLALLALHRALQRPGIGRVVAASLAMALCAATSWPSTVALAIGVLCYLASQPLPSLRSTLPRVAGIAVLGYCLGAPWMLPSNVLGTFTNAGVMGDAPVKDTRYYLAWIALLFGIVVLRTVLLRIEPVFGLRFSALWVVALGGVVLTAAYWDIRLVPQPLRFHVAMEAPFALTVAFLLDRLASLQPRWRIAVPTAAALCLLQIPQYRASARSMINGLDIRSTVEYRVASWFDRHMPGERVYVPGSISFWMNAFSDTPQFTGCCTQSVVNPGAAIPSYLIPSGYGTREQDADFTLLWLKAYGVHAIEMDGPKSPEAYHPYLHPDKFSGKLRELWRDGDDAIYEVPQKIKNPARVLDPGDLVSKPPDNGIDVPQLRKFVGSIDRDGPPDPAVSWRDSAHGSITGPVPAKQVVWLPVNYHSGWSATVAGRPRPVRKDGLGFLVIDPGCDGSCRIDLSWSAGWEPAAALALSLCAWLAILIRVIGRGRPGSGPPAAPTV